MTIHLFIPPLCHETLQIGNIAFAFMCHHQTFLAWKSLKHATQRRFAISTHLALLGGLCLSITLGVTGACHPLVWVCDQQHLDITVGDVVLCRHELMLITQRIRFHRHRRLSHLL